MELSAGGHSEGSGGVGDTGVVGLTGVGETGVVGLTGVGVTVVVVGSLAITRQEKPVPLRWEMDMFPRRE